LPLEQAANVPVEAFGAKLFSRGEFPAIGVNGAAKAGARCAPRAREQQNNARRFVEKTRNSRAFPRYREFFWRDADAK
jgi:hypothetical protein